MLPSHKSHILPAIAASVAMLAGCQSPAATSTAPAPGDLSPTRRLTATSTATASATSGTYVAARAIDGDQTTEWQAPGSPAPTLTLDRGASGTLTAVAIKAKPGQAFAIQVSDDGATFRTVGAAAANTSWNLETRTMPAGTTGRYVRLAYNAQTTNVMVFELQPQGTLTAPTTAPTAAPTAAPSAGAPSITASATSGTYVAARAIDADQATEWQAPGSPAPSLTLDRGASGALTAVATKAKPGQAFAIQVSDDGATFRTVGAATANTTWNPETRSLPAGTTGRYVRLAFDAQTSNVMVFDLQVQGSLSTPTAAPSVAPTVAPTPAPTVAPTVAPTIAPTPAPATGTIKTRFGNQSVPRSADGTHTRGYQLMSELGMTTIREGFNWKNIETGDRQYVTWMNYFDDKVAQFNKMGVTIQAMITDTPTWASTDGTNSGVPKGLSSAIFADGTDVYKPGVGPNPANTFGQYMFDMVTRYKGKIGVWEMWNEPDYPSGDLGAGSTGSTNGAPRYWHGTVQEYVRLLKVGSTIVRGIDPSARVTLGGLGYENYLDAILANGGASYFDVVDFHAYGTDKTTSNGVLNSAWGFLGRYNAMKAKMNARGITGKTYSASETGMTANNQPEQANYVAKVFATGLGLGDVEMVQWAVFTNPGFNNIGIIDQATMSVKTQGYTAYTAATKQLTGATPTGALTGTGLQGYTFRRADGKNLAVLWSSGTGNVSFTAPFPVAQALNVQGTAIAVPTSVGISPVYLVGQ